MIFSAKFVCEPVEIKKVRLISLASANPKDVLNLYATLYDSRDLRKYHNLGNDYNDFTRRRNNQEEYWDYVNYIIDNDKKLENVFIILNKEDAFVGVCKLFNRFNDPTTMYVSYTVLLSQQGESYASSAMQIMIDYVKKQKRAGVEKYANVKRLKAEINIYNKASMRVVEKCGFKYIEDVRNSFLPMHLYLLEL
jgi:RimJ/RimL family protein N-acetyltransferase